MQCRLFSVLLPLLLSSALGEKTENSGFLPSVAPRLEAHLRQAEPEERISVIIRLRDRIDLSSLRSVPGNERSSLPSDLRNKSHKRRRSLAAFLRRSGGQEIRSLWINNSIAVSAPVALIRQAAEMPDVAEIYQDSILTFDSGPEAQTAETSWHLNLIEAPALWSQGIDGTGIVVANMDTGVDLHHPDLQSRWRGGANSWKDVYQQHPLPYDYHGHGTATMGLMVGGDASGATIGIAPGATWIAVKMFDDSGNAPYSKIHEGFQWLLDPDGDPNTPDAPHVVNNSWGLHFAVNDCIHEFAYDIEALKTAGIAVIFAAGNAGPLPATSLSPANNPHILSVGAVGESFTIASFSSRGPSPCGLEIFPSLSAPGVNLKTADLTGDGAILNSYAAVSGTSHAAAVVSGAAALLRSAFPEMKVRQLEKTLILSSADWGEAGPDTLYGHGVINLRLAYAYGSHLCPEDLNTDYQVDLSDLLHLSSEWLSPNCVGCGSDLNDDWKIDLQDFALLAGGFGKNPCPSMCTTDFDRDYQVGMPDLVILAGEWLSVNCPDCQSDVHADGQVDLRDYAVFADQYGRVLCP